MLLFMDGMAHYGTLTVTADTLAALRRKYTSVTDGPGGTTWQIVPEGRFGNCIRYDAVNGNTGGSLYIAPFTNRLGYWSPTIKTGVCGFAIKIDDLQKASIGGPLFHILESGIMHLRVYVDATGIFILVRSANTEGATGYPIIAQSIEGLNSNTWQYVEFKWKIDDTDGYFEIRVGGVTVLTFTGNTVEQTYYPTMGFWNAVGILGIAQQVGGALTIRICDLYLADWNYVDDDDVHDFLGDGTVLLIKPNAPGDHADWTSNGGPNWDAVNDPAPDGDATWVNAQSTTAIDTHHYEDIPTAAVVKGIQVCILARKETEGGAQIAPVVRPTTTDYIGPIQGVGNILFDHYTTQTYDLNPQTLNKFTPAELNATQFGVKKML